MLGLYRRHTGFGASTKGCGVLQDPLCRGSELVRRSWLEIPHAPTPAGADLAVRDTVGFAASVGANAAAVLNVQNVLVPFDCSSTAVRLLRWVASTARNTGAKVSVLHVVRPGVQPAGPGTPIHADVSRQRLKAAREWLSRALHRACPEANLDGEVLAGRPTDEIIQYARSRKMGLIVMTAHGERTLEHLCVSATTERVTRRAPCPVLVIPETVLLREAREDEALAAGCGRILVPTDFSADSLVALRRAAAISRQQNAELCVLNCSSVDRQQTIALKGATLDWESARSAARERLQRWLGLHLEFPGRLKPIVHLGPASVYVLLRQAALLGADLLVFSPRGYSWAERLRLRSSTDAILRHAHCPVLSVRSEALNAGQ